MIITPVIIQKAVIFVVFVVVLAAVAVVKKLSQPPGVPLFITIVRHFEAEQNGKFV